MSNSIKIKMSLAKSTKGTHVYKCDDSDAAISSLYIKKESLNKTPPETIIVVVVEE
tara:strand:- start:245 stop:412 length:168 start_codon:yes stop_codon:yes gene_type:complete